MKKAILLLLSTVAITYSMSAQLVSGNAFLKGRFIEVGIAPNQQYGTNVSSPAGYHPRGWGAYPSNSLGFVSDPMMDGWTVGTPNYIGCYFLPGTPQEGWDMSIDGTWFRSYAVYTPYGLDRTVTPAGPTFTGSNVDYGMEGSRVYAIWKGQAGNIEVTTKTHFDTNHIYFITDVKMKNIGTTAAPNVFYSRTLDPDNESAVPGGGNPSTINNIELQPDLTTGDFRALVSAKGQAFPTVSYLGIGADDCRATVYLRTSTTTGGTILYPGTGPHHVKGNTDYNKTKGFSNTSDCAMGIIFDIGTLAAGDSTTFSYAYVLNSAYIDSAFKVLAPSFSIDGATNADGDTLYACIGDTLDIVVTGGEGFEWNTIVPTTGLVGAAGRTSRVVVQDAPITYAVIGEGIACPVFDTMRITVVPRIPVDAGRDSTVRMCSNADAVNLLTLLGGTPEPGGVWTGPGVSPGGIFAPSGMVEGFYNFVYTASDGECFNTATLTIEIINDVDIDFDFVLNKGCNADTVIFTNNSVDLVSFKWNYGDGSGYDDSVENPIHVYNTQGEYNVWLIGQNDKGCVDSVLEYINTTHPLEAAFDMSNDSVCQTSNTVHFYDRSIGTIVAYAWDFGDGATATIPNPSHSYDSAGTFTVRLIVTEDIGCQDTIYKTVYVDPTPYINFSLSPDSICKGERITINAEYYENTTGMSWDFGDGTILNEVTTEVTHNYPDAGTYVVTATSTHPVCGSLQVKDTVVIKPYPQINIGSDTMICLSGEPIMLDPAAVASNPPGTVYYWSTGDSTSVLKITEPGTYRITADLNGCLTSDEVIVNKDCYADIPNTFTPNGDGVNDYFFPRQLLTEGVVDFYMVIYNRWGEKVFETNNPNGRGWDGRLNNKPQPFGVYVYQISIRYKNQAAEKYTGNVTLMR